MNTDALIARLRAEALAAAQASIDAAIENAIGAGQGENPAFLDVGQIVQSIQLEIESSIANAINERLNLATRDEELLLETLPREDDSMMRWDEAEEEDDWIGGNARAFMDMGIDLTTALTLDSMGIPPFTGMAGRDDRSDRTRFFPDIDSLIKYIEPMPRGIIRWIRGDEFGYEAAISDTSG